MAKQYFCTKPDGKLHYGHTILTGFGFLASSIAWAIYDPYITKILNALLNSESAGFIKDWSNWLVEKLPILAKLAAAQGEDVALVGGGFTLVPLFIGIIMTFDNIFGVIFQPTFGKLSDRCHSKLGKRRPFIVFGAPVSALLFALIPIVFLATKNSSYGLPITMLCIILFVFTMSLWRAPVVALMPDLTPPNMRSEGNAVINLMGGVGSAVGMVAGKIAIALCTLFTGLTAVQIAADEIVSFPYVFAIGAVIMIVGMLVVLFCVKEPSSKLEYTAAKNQALDAAAQVKAEKEAKKAEKAARKAVTLSKPERKSLIFMLGCLFFLFCGTNAITTFFALFAQEILHMITSEASFIMLIFAVVAGAAAIPAGKMGKKFGRKKTILIGISTFLAAFVVFFGVFVGMLGKQNMGISSYVTVNNAYSAVDEQRNEFNAKLTEEAKEKDIKLGDEDIVAMDKYIEYRQTLEAGGDVSAYPAIYAEFDAALKAYSDEAVQTAVANGANEEEVNDVFESVTNVSKEILGADENVGFGTALLSLSDAVAGVTKILRVLIYPVLILGGAANMFITVNTLPLVLEIGGQDKVGTFTGYYYTATFSAQIASPIVYGFVRMFAGTYMSLFYYAPVAFAIAILFLLVVKHGEALPDEVIKAAEAEGND